MSNCEEGGLAGIYNIGPDHKHWVSIIELEAAEEAGHIQVKGVAAHTSGVEQEIAFCLQAEGALFAEVGLKSAEEILGRKEVAAALLLGNLTVYDDGHHRTRFDIAEQSVAVWYKGTAEGNQKPHWE